MIQTDHKVLLITLLAVAVMLAIMPFDLAIMQYVNVHNTCRPIFDAITDIGLAKWYEWPSGLIAVIGFILWRTKKMSGKFLSLWRASIQIFASVACAGLFTDIMKRLFARARPVEFLQHGIYGFFHWHEVFGHDTHHFQSFPSGHATTMMSLATAITLMLPEKYRWARIPLFVFIGIIAASRIMVTAHYPSDVIAGTIIGIWGAVLVQRAMPRILGFLRRSPV